MTSTKLEKMAYKLSNIINKITQTGISKSAQDDEDEREEIPIPKRLIDKNPKPILPGVKEEIGIGPGREFRNPVTNEWMRIRSFSDLYPPPHFMHEVFGYDRREPITDLSNMTDQEIWEAIMSYGYRYGFTPNPWDGPVYFHLPDITGERGSDEPLDYRTFRQGRQRLINMYRAIANDIQKELGLDTLMQIRKNGVFPEDLAAALLYAYLTTPHFPQIRDQFYEFIKQQGENFNHYMLETGIQRYSTPPPAYRFNKLHPADGREWPPAKMPVKPKGPIRPPRPPDVR